MPESPALPTHDDGLDRVMARRAAALFSPGASSFLSAVPLGIAGRMGSGKSPMMKAIAAMAVGSGMTVRWVSVTDSDLGIRHRRSKDTLVFVDDADLMPAAVQAELTELVKEPAARVAVSWDPARRTVVDVAGHQWRAGLRRVEHLAPLSVDEIDEAFGHHGFSGFGRLVAEWTAGNHLFVWFCLQHALATRPHDPETLWSTVSTAGPATDLVDTVLASHWQNPVTVSRTLRLLALAGGERAPFLLAAPFLPHQDLAGYQDAMDELTRAGLADQRTWQVTPRIFSHAVNSALTMAERDDAQRAIATALRDRGYDSCTVARHLVGIRELRAGWELDTIREAINLSIAAQDLDMAARCLDRIIKVEGNNGRWDELIGFLQERMFLPVGETQTHGTAQEFSRPHLVNSPAGTNQWPQQAGGPAKEHVRAGQNLPPGDPVPTSSGREIFTAAEVLAELSQAETRVALLVAQGFRNREIAQELCIGLRTVETHLTHIYRKLGIRGRTELISAMTSLPDGEHVTPLGRTREHGSSPMHH